MLHRKFPNNLDPLLLAFARVIYSTVAIARQRQFQTHLGVPRISTSPVFSSDDFEKLNQAQKLLTVSCIAPLCSHIRLRRCRQLSAAHP
ncbi:hypothetical protein PoB_004981300 [Plakobranchus ocellatus]|uniref:Uncharacterized protein n=1 Tax=Plakobranchus ocellatus TaxID=259542 RepID=A0AAV4BWY9_9GAST|nr:hypothetical protein PoB_004981300 [Plakobranchus ocellatus]